MTMNREFLSGASGADFRKRLDRWTADGLIDAAQAARIEAAEAPAGSQARAAGVRAGVVGEALGYAGGVLAIAAGIFMVRELWPALPTGGGLAFAAVASVALGAAGAVVRTTGDPAFRRLRSVLWLMS